MVGLAIGCAVLGAVCSALGAALQHAGVRDVGELTLRRAYRLAASRRWLLGFSVLFVAAILQILAFWLAPVTVVAPLAVLSLPIIAMIDVRRFTPRFAVAVAAATGGVATFVAIAAGSAVPTDVPEKVVLQAGQLVAAAVFVFGMIATFQTGTIRCLAFAVGAGAAYGLVSVLVRDVTTALPHIPWLSFAALLIAFAVGAWFIQLGYSSGPADLVVAGQTVVNPIVASWIGMELLEETEGASLGTEIALIASGAVAVTGIIVLAQFHRSRVVT
ncbi:hypothetical protein Lesp02_58730 [Lentzea sp. NBRC 105346]|uniref:hypothetical protein n=1 Tax=Lentzea sp. NBRC 105346 TaxID=3032205 RepID=UPI0024A2DA78|nr:hypothetical protein [Lentzea sp. NBRC 105346]GLZ33685.1 hypothetical protein Lesp02_58730 [Lentzea sp. NBRC 105346]